MAGERERGSVLGHLTEQRALTLKTGSTDTVIF